MFNSEALNSAAFNSFSPGRRRSVGAVPDTPRFVVFRSRRTTAIPTIKNAQNFINPDRLSNPPTHMPTDIHQLIAAINPDLFCEPYLQEHGRVINLIANVKDSRNQHGILAAAQIARPRQSQPMDLQQAQNQNPFSLAVLKNPIEKHQIVYDNFGLNVAAEYFWILDQLEGHYPHLKQIDKLIDNFVSAPGSGHSADLAAQTAKAHQQVIKLLDHAHKLSASISNQIPHLKQLKDRLEAQTNAPSETNQSNGTQDQQLHSQIQIAHARLLADLNLLRALARWLKPYLRTAQQLGQTLHPDASVVSIFNTTVLELTLLAQADYDLQEDIDSGLLPKSFRKIKHRPYYPVLVLELRFRGLPERARQGGYLFRGRLDIVFTSYGLNQHEIQTLKDQIQKDDLADLFRALTNATDQTVEQLQQQLDQVLNPEDQSHPKPDSDDRDINPFSALFSVFDLFRSQPTKTPSDVPAPDSAVEKLIRNQALLRARTNCRAFYENFKQAHQMPVMYDVG